MAYQYLIGVIAMDHNDVMFEMLQSINTKLDKQDDKLGQISVTLAKYEVYSETQSRAIEKIQEIQKEDKKELEQKIKEIVILKNEEISTFPWEKVLTKKNISLVIGLIASICTIAAAALQ